MTKPKNKKKAKATQSSKGKCSVTFLPYGKKIKTECGRELLAAAIEAGVHMTSSCGGDGVCGRCKVVIKKGDYVTEPSGRITPKERKKGYVLACLTSIRGDMVVFVPPESRLELDKVQDEDSKYLRLQGIYSAAEDVDKADSVIEEGLFGHSPLATKLYLQLPKPSLEDKLSDLERVYREIRKKSGATIMQTGLKNIRRLGRVLRTSNWRTTVTLGKRNETTEIVLVEPGDRSKANYGVAFDIGTTTISGQIVDLRTNKVLGTKATYNRQAVFGNDVITRIIFASEEDGLERLHHAVIDNLNGIIRELAKERNISLNDITGVICAGNMTMIHLLLRVDPTFIRREPYVPTANFVPVIRAAEAGIKINPRGLLSCVPGVSTYVGGDITAGVISSGIADAKKLHLLIDIGTNGELVLGSKEWLICCAASAGPAFEGSGVTCGVRASSGAIQKVRIDPVTFEPKYETIGKTKAKGICGSGYIDVLAELYRTGLIDRDGKFDKSVKTKRLRDSDVGMEYLLVYQKEADVDYDIIITEADIENLKRSKGAIYSAASFLLTKLGLSFDDVDKIFIAGGFGTYLDIDKAVTIGLLPDQPRSKFTFIGNSSLAGSREILLSYEAMRKSEDVARRMTYLELSNEQAYMNEYISSLFFPHTDLNCFPSVKRAASKARR